MRIEAIFNLLNLRSLVTLVAGLLVFHKAMLIANSSFYFRIKVVFSAIQAFQSAHNFVVSDNDSCFELQLNNH